MRVSDPGRAVAVVLHDVAPETWPAYQVLLERLAQRPVPLTLLVAPYWHRRQPMDQAPAFAAWLAARQALGDECALHGWTHWDEAPAPRSPAGWWRRRVLTAAEAEFSALPADEAAERLDAGLAALAAISVVPDGFVAPAWQLGAGAWCALSRYGFVYTSTRDALYEPLTRRAYPPAPSLVMSARSALRRRLSPAWNRCRLARFDFAPLIRLGIHPADCAHPRLVDFWVDVLDKLLITRVATTKARWCAGQRPDC